MEVLPSPFSFRTLRLVKDIPYLLGGGASMQFNRAYNLLEKKQLI
jgi:hypothetical protein